MAWRLEHGAVGIAMRGQGEVRHRGAWECETARRRPGCSSIFVDESRRRCAAFADAPERDSTWVRALRGSWEIVENHPKPSHLAHANWARTVGALRIDVFSLTIRQDNNLQGSLRARPRLEVGLSVAWTAERREPVWAGLRESGLS